MSLFLTTTAELASTSSPAGVRVRHRRGSLLSLCRSPCISWFLLTSGDLSLNFVPRPICARCEKLVLDSAAILQYDQCDRQMHCKCELLTVPPYRRLSVLSEPWFSGVCQLPPLDDRLFETRISTQNLASQARSAPDCPSRCAAFGAFEVSMSAVVEGDAPRNHSFSSRGINKSLILWYSNCRSANNKVIDLRSTAASLPTNSIFLLTETASRRQSPQSCLTRHCAQCFVLIDAAEVGVS